MHNIISSNYYIVTVSIVSNAGHVVKQDKSEVKQDKSDIQ